MTYGTNLNEYFGLLRKKITKNFIKMGELRICNTEQGHTVSERKTKFFLLFGTYTV